VVYVNAINVAQIAMAGALGVLLFSEPISIWLSTGSITMSLGFSLLAIASSRRQSKAEVQREING
jgi:drug/metabolite transporter (DMT)-like permease